MVNEKYIREIEKFEELNDDTISELAEIGVISCYKKGSHIFRDKDKNSNIYIIYSGKVSIYKLNESAQKKILFILDKGKIINDVVFDNMSESVNCEVFENVEIIAFEKSKFENIMAKDFQLTKIIIQSLSTKVRRLYRQMKNSTPIKVEKRVAAKLWKLARDYGVKSEEGILIDLNISVTYLADMFGTPRETISRALKILQKEDLIINKNKRFIIKDKDMLAKFFKGL